MIRISRPDDRSDIVSVWRLAVDATHDFLAPADRSAIEAEVEAFVIASPVLVAVDTADRAIAFMIVENGHMEALFVHPRHRGSGIGRRLVQHALAADPALTVDVNEANGQAIGFYVRMGFVEAGRSALDGQGRPYPLLHLKLP